MKIKKEEFKKAVKRFLETLDKEKISDLRDLEKRLNSRLSITPNEKEFITIENRPSEAGTTAYTVSYVTETGIPVEIKVNYSLGYSKIIIKTETEMNGYVPFSMDRFGNIMQTRDLDFADFERTKKELGNLV